MKALTVIYELPEVQWSQPVLKTPGGLSDGGYPQDCGVYPEELNQVLRVNIGKQETSCVSGRREAKSNHFEIYQIILHFFK